MKCSYTFETAVLLNLHIQNHTGEMLIDESYAEKVKSPERKSETTINKPNSSTSRLTKLTSSQPQSHSYSKSFSTEKRSLSLSPEAIQSNKKSYKA